MSDINTHVDAVAGAFAAGVEREGNYVAVDKDNGVHVNEFCGQDAMAFKANPDPLLSPMDHRNFDRPYTFALVSSNRGPDNTKIAVLDNIATCSFLPDAPGRRFMFIEIMAKFLERLPPEYTAVRTGVISSDVLLAKMTKHTENNNKFFVKDSQLWCIR